MKDDKLKINVIIPFITETGGIKVIFNYCDYLVKQGHDVVCYMPYIQYKFNNTNAVRIKSMIGDILKHRLRLASEHLFKYKLVFKITNYFVRDADLIIATAWPTARDVFRLNASKGKKVYFVQSHEIWSSRNIKEVEETYKYKMNRICVSTELHNILKEKYNVESYILLNGINENEFIKQKKKYKKSILMMYSFQPCKQSDLGLEVLKRIKKLDSDIEVNIFGIKKPHDIDESFNFYENPSRDTILELYRNSAIYLYTSNQKESWGLPVLEAMANKCVVIGNYSGCVKEIGNNMKNLIITDGSIEAYISNVLLVLGNPKLITSIQNNAFETANSLKMEKQNKKLESIISNIIKKG
ncbi:glycosyltransferase family 4 protein [Mediterraneibacter gnavus]|uniref:glycosyltransferase family 4 protein n=1 Tax=Mediterraneibacter gnavus TaxID=33038 RepID=UPI003561E387